MNETELISIVVPVYNVQQYLAKCIDSILNQSYKEFEVLLIDDGSTDLSGTICDKYVKVDSRIKTYHKKNGGLSSARNYGIKVSKGKYITFIDSDDYITTDYLKTLFDMIINNNVKMAICSYTIIRGKKEKNIGIGYENKILSTQECLSRMLLEKGFTVSSSAKLYSRELFEDISYPENKLYEDNDTTYKLILKCDRIAYNNKSVYFYIIRKNSITTCNFTKRNMDYIRVSDRACDNIVMCYPELKDICQYRKIYVRLTILKKMFSSSLDKEMYVYKDEIISYLKDNYKLIKKNQYADKKIVYPLTLLKLNVFLFKIGVNLYERVR